MWESLNYAHSYEGKRIQGYIYNLVSFLWNTQHLCTNGRNKPLSPCYPSSSPVKQFLLQLWQHLSHIHLISNLFSNQ